MLISISQGWGGSGDFEQGAARNYTRIFLGQSNRDDDTELSIRNSPLCPKVGDRDPYDREAIISRVSVRLQDESDRLWRITVSSTTQVEPERSPLDEPAQITWDSDQYEALACVDKDGKPARNTAGDILLFPYEDSRWVATVSKNVATVPRWITDYNNAINSGSVTVDGIRFAKRQLMCKHIRIGSIQTARVNNREIRYRQISFQLHVRHDGWVIKHPNVGFNELREFARPVIDRDTGEVLRDSDGRPIYQRVKRKERITIGDPPEYPSEPQPLDREGRVIVDPDIDDLIEVEIRRYRELNFNRLPLR